MDEPENINHQVQELYSQALSAILEKIQELGLTQEEVGLRCGMEQGTISRYLSEDRGKNLSFKTILALAIGLDIDLPTLLKTYNSPQERLKALISEINKIVANG